MSLFIVKARGSTTLQSFTTTQGAVKLNSCEEDEEVVLINGSDIAATHGTKITAEYRVRIQLKM